MITYIGYLIIGTIMAIKLNNLTLMYWWFGMMITDFGVLIAGIIHKEVEKRKEYLKRDIVHIPKNTLFEYFLDLFIKKEIKEKARYINNVD